MLFTTYKGTFENDDLVITCEDIYPMDLGNAVFTEFKMNEDVAAYMAENIELFNCDFQLVHSHHCMATQPSGTDLNTLREEGNERNCFVSLIVNNAGTYYAAITRKVQTKSEVTVKNLGTSYEFFGEGSKEIEHKDTKAIRTIEKEIIEYFDLEVERHEVINDLSYLDDRFEEIENKKRVSKKKLAPSTVKQNFNIKEDTEFLDYLHDGGKELSLWDDTPIDKNNDITAKDEEKLRKIAIEWQPNPKKIHKAVCNIITCNLIINPDKFNLKQWIHLHMVNVYKRIFGSEPNDTSLNPFNQWKDFITEFTIDNFEDDDAPDELLDDWDLYTSKVAEAICNELQEYIAENDYIQAYQEAFQCYMVE